jgi:NMD protein affecting ribosome stability and mRNA decay
MAECTNCGDYTKFEGGLCYKCYKESGDINKGQANVKDTLEAKKEGGNDWVHNVIKGRIAETIMS